MAIGAYFAYFRQPKASLPLAPLTWLRHGRAVNAQTPPLRTMGQARGSRIKKPAAQNLFLGIVAKGALVWLRRVAGFGLAYVAIALSLAGVFRDPASHFSEQALALIGLVGVLLVRLFEHSQHRKKTSDTTWLELELGTLLIAAAFVIIEFTGGPSGLAYPIVYALVAFLVAFHRLWMSFYFLGLILLVEGGIMWIQEGSNTTQLYLSHAAFVVLISFLYSLFLKSEISERRQELTSAIDSHLNHVNSEAKDFRLTSGLSLTARGMSQEELKERRQIGSIQAIHDSLYNVLAVAERALKPHTVALFWMQSDDSQMRIKELRSKSDALLEHPIRTGEGLVGAVAKRRENVVLNHLKPHHTGLVYYRVPQKINHFAGVPVLEGNHLRGVLIADRTSDEPFVDEDISVMTTLAGEIIRAVQVERIFSEMDTERYQRESFYEASRSFNQALSVSDVSKVAVETVSRLVQLDFASVAVAVPDVENTLTIEAVHWSKQSDRLHLLGDFGHLR